MIGEEPEIWRAGAAQVEFAGRPEQVQDALPEKPAPGVICNEYVAVWPATMVAELPPGAVGAMVNAGLAVADRVMVCGELGASSVMEMEALRAPSARGVKLMPRVQLALTA